MHSRRWTSERFCARGELNRVLQKSQQDALAAVERLAVDDVLSHNLDLLVASICTEHQPVPPHLDWDAFTRTATSEATFTHRDPFGRDVKVNGSQVTITVPGGGRLELLKYQATTWTSIPPSGEVGEDVIYLDIVERALTADLVTTKYIQWREAVTQLVNWIATDTSASNAVLEQNVQQALTRRKQRLLELRDLDAALNIPIAAAPEATRIPIAVTRKIVPVPRRAAADFAPEHALDVAHYEDAVTLTTHWARGVERSPDVANKLVEEELRDQLLILLNSHFEGRGGGELFNGHGKTDILIRVENRNVFIAECKIWHGKKAAAEALDQLLSYLVWRDSKAALVVFIRNKRPQDAIQALHAAIKEHPACRQAKPVNDPGKRADYILSADDEGRVVHLAVLPVVTPIA